MSGLFPPGWFPRMLLTGAIVGIVTFGGSTGPAQAQTYRPYCYAPYYNPAYCGYYARYYAPYYPRYYGYGYPAGGYGFRGGWYRGGWYRGGYRGGWNNGGGGFGTVYHNGAQ